MQPKNSGNMELKKFVMVIITLFLLSQPLFAASETKKESPEEIARVDRFLGAQEKGRPIEGKILKEKLGTNPEKVLKKQLYTHPPKRYRSEPEEKEKTVIKNRLEIDKIPPVKNIAQGDQKMSLKPESRFRYKKLEKPLEAGEKAGK